MIIIPAIDLRNGRCVRLTQGRREDARVYDGDPLEIALGYEAGGARMIHVVDLDGAFSDPNSLNRQRLDEIVSRIKVPVQFGGGLRSLEQVKQVMELGVTRVVIGTLAVESPEQLEQMLRLFGAHRIAVGIDARDGRVLTRGWETDAEVSALELARTVALLGVGRVVYTDITRDGMLTGVNVEQTCALARDSGLKVTASGGVSSLDDIERLLTAVGRSSLDDTTGAGEVDSVIIGKALYEGRFTLAQALEKVEKA
jgi:phosphoribosylformimino-5-aminoimidazole carboxamide ribotide isomerase